MEYRFYCLTLHKNSVSEVQNTVTYQLSQHICWYYWNVLEDELDKAIKSFEQLKRRYSTSRRLINILNSCLQCLLPFWVSCKVLFNLFRFILRETINTFFFNLQCAISGYGCCDVRPHLNIYLSLCTSLIDELREIEKINIKTITWWKWLWIARSLGIRILTSEFWTKTFANDVFRYFSEKRWRKGQGGNSC